MNRKISLIAVLLLLLPLVAACGAPATAQQEPPTPTPLPPDPALERPTYKVQRGVIERVLEFNGRITPVDLVRISFQREGRVETVNVKRGDKVQAGDVLAELQQDEALDDLRAAEDGLAQAQRALEDARKQNAKDIKQKEADLASAQEDLKRLLPGGEADPIRVAQQALEKEITSAEDAHVSGSEAKTNAEVGLEKATESLQDGQKAYSKAFWENNWVERYGTDPKTPFITDPTTGKTTPNYLTDEQKESYQTALVMAQRALRDLERALDQAQRALDKARKDEIEGNRTADESVAEKRRALDSLLKGRGSPELRNAQRAVEAARLSLDEARTASFSNEITAVERAQRELDKARKKVNDGRVIAPQDGEVLALSIGKGDEVQAFASVVEIADPSRLEISADLPDTQMRQLAEGQPAEVSLLSRPDVSMPALIRRLPAPYGAGGSGAVQEEDRTTRFQVSDTKGQTLTPGSVAKIRIVLERKADVLWLPPEAIRAFEGRRFVVVREGERERRTPVKIGIETDDRVEILEGVKEGDVVVGQ